MFLMIAAMGLSTTYQNLANVIWKSKFKQLPKLFKVGTINISGIFIGKTDMLCLVLSAIALVILLFLINKTKFGLHVRDVYKRQVWNVY